MNSSSVRPVFSWDPIDIQVRIGARFRPISYERLSEALLAEKPINFVRFCMHDSHESIRI